MFNRLKVILVTSLSLPVLLSPNIATASCNSDSFIGSICMVGFNFCPRGFAAAEGQLMSIASNNALFSLLGTMYGGDGRTTFALPDLRGRVPVGVGQGPGLSSYTQGRKSGTETVTLTKFQIPSHSHTATLNAESAGGTTEIPAGNKLSNSRRSAIYSADIATADTPLASNSIIVSNTGGNQAHENRPPSLAIKYCIATQGIYPSRY